MADFSGVTFAKQNVTPADDGLIRRALLSDGILTGCNFSYSGYTLSMRAGALIVCGRQIRHPSAQNWAVVGAKSGYARLVLDIDLTKSSTKDLFEQVSTTLEYATDEDGFTELTQEDLNVSGSRYQIVLCVVSLGDAGITGIVSQLDVAEGGGGGNFNVVGGLTQPTSPKENMIWVKADVKKSPKYVFAVAAPDSPSDGLIWFLATNAGIITQTSVYTDGTWDAADTYMYLGNEWVQIAATSAYLLNGSDQCAGITGGWNGIRYYWSSGLPGGVPSVTWADDGVSVKASSTAAGSLLVTKDAIDLTRFSNLAIECTSASSEVWLLLSTGTGDQFKTGEVASVALKAGIIYLDISAFSGMHYIGIQCRANNSAKIKSILMK